MSGFGLSCRDHTRFCSTLANNRYSRVPRVNPHLKASMRATEVATRLYCTQKNTRATRGAATKHRFAHGFAVTKLLVKGAVESDRHALPSRG